jgi:outer membrane translocation and assembly module TamA
MLLYPGVMISTRSRGGLMPTWGFSATPWTYSNTMWGSDINFS